MNLKIENQYFGPVTSWIALCGSTDVDLCKYESWRKSSFRNRCILPGANGLINLTVPILGGREQKGIYGDVLIDWKSDWQQIHWRSIFSVYGKSPWFVYFREELENLYSRKPDLLFEWNMLCNDWITKHLGFPLNAIQFDRDFKNSAEKIFDCQDAVLPNNFQQSNSADHVRYSQVFQDRIGFQPNMSILDLICCEGRRARILLDNAGREQFGAIEIQ